MTRLPMLRLAAFATLCLASAAGPAHAQKKVSFQLDFIATGVHAPYYYAREQGWYEKAGIDLSIDVGKGSAFAAQTVGSGAAQIGEADFATALVAISKGADIKAVMNIYGQSPQTFYWLRGTGIETYKNFPGRSIGNPPGDAGRAMFPGFARSAGIDPKTIRFVNLAPAAKVAALRSGTVDIITDFYNGHDLKVKEFGEKLGFLRWRDLGIDPYGKSIIVNTDFLKSNPDVVKAFVSVTQKAFAFCIKSIDPCLDALVAKVTGLDRSVQKDEWGRLRELSETPEAKTISMGWFNDGRVVSDYGTVDKYIGFEKQFDPKTTYTNEFLDKSITLQN